MVERDNQTKGKRSIRLLTLLLIALPLLVMSGGNTAVARAASSGGRVPYYYYIQEYENAARPEVKVTVDVTEFEKNTGGEAEIYQDREGTEKGVYIGEEYTEITFTVQVPESGLYNMELTYCPDITQHMKILFSVMIDGELPYTEAAACVLTRTYQNGAIEQDKYGNDIRPDSIQQQALRTQILYDQNGMNGNLSFYFEKGTHTITLCFDGTPLLIESLSLMQEPYMLSYQNYISVYTQKGYTETADVLRLFQAENYYLQSDSTLWPTYDQSSLLTQPFEYGLTRINIGGGSNWDAPGEWISWKIEVPEDGFYNIGIKYRQPYLEGLFSSRSISIDGEVPFAELSSVRFDYTSSWENLLLGNEYETYSIYLTQGEHILTMENVVGDLGDTMEVLQTCIANLNELYLDIIMITSSEPDQYRDYYLTRLLPELPEQLKANAQMLTEEVTNLIEVVGKRGTETAFLENIALNLINYAENIEELTTANRLEDFKNDISSLSSKITEYQQQGLDIDYIAVLSANEEMPRAKENFWEWIKYQVGTFLVSFREPTVKDGSEDDGEEMVRVWVNVGSDQFQIIQNMVDDMFIPKTGIKVDLELVQGTLIEATVAGKGPDVSFFVDADTVVNLALRGALQELNEFEGYEELLDEYIEGVEIPFTLEGRTYGIPNIGDFLLMFVRTDVFEKLGLTPPDTWEEMYDVAQVLQRNNMSLGSAPNFQTLLYQKGGSYFNEELTQVLFDDPVAVEAFTQYTDYFTQYGFPLTYDFVSRFRTGDMPIGIANYSTYNTLKYSAPEINGLWNVYTIPGSVREDGTVDYTQADTGGTGVIMFKDHDNEENAWEFIKWWCGAEAQQRYAEQLEAVIGIAARYATTNQVVLQNIGWTNRELRVLNAQIERLVYVPIVPGNYYVTRGVNNTYYGVVNDDENVRALLTNWTKKINEELTRKRLEFYQNN